MQNHAKAKLSGMPTISDLLERIRQRPGMYLGERSLTALRSTLAGYELALGLHRIEGDLSMRLPVGFNDWVAYRQHFYEPTSGWKNMILSKSQSEAVAFDRFFELLDQFTDRKSRIVAKLADVRKTYTVSSGGTEQTERYPANISLVTFTDDPGFFAQSDEPGCSLPGGDFEFYPSLKSFEVRMRINRSLLTVVDTETFERWISSV